MSLFWGRKFFIAPKARTQEVLFSRRFSYYLKIVAARLEGLEGRRPPWLGENFENSGLKGTRNSRIFWIFKNFFIFFLFLCIKMSLKWSECCCCCRRCCSWAPPDRADESDDSKSNFFCIACSVKKDYINIPVNCFPPNFDMLFRKASSTWYKLG